MPSQAERILSHLKAGNRLTPREALDRFGCMRLAARIHELREAGHDIRDRSVTLSDGTRYAEYWLEEEAWTLRA